MSSGGYVKKSSRSWVLPSLKPFKCTNPDCTKSFLNQNGLKYHKAYGTCVKKTAPDAQSSDRPYFCYDGECGKAYKNMNGLRYHYLHSGDHGDAGMNMLNDGTHPPFLDRSGSGDRHHHHAQQHNSNTRHGSSSQETSTESEETTPSAYADPQTSSYIPSQPMAIQGAETMSPNSVSQSLLEAVNLFSDQPAPQHGYASYAPHMAAYQNAHNYQAASVPNDWSGTPSTSYQDYSNGGFYNSNLNSNAHNNQQQYYNNPNNNNTYNYSVSQPQNFNPAFAPPPLTFGARTHRFHPYSLTSRSYLPPTMQSPSKAIEPTPKPRRLSL